MVVSETLAEGILSFVNYGMGIVVLMIIWEAYRFISGGRDPGRVTSEGVKRLWETGKKWNHKIQRGRKREEARTLREYYEEKAELKLVEDIPNKVNNTITVLTQTQNESNENPGRWIAITNYLTGIESDLGKAIDEYRQVSKSTYRQQRETGRLLRLLRDENSISDTDINELQMLEKSILKAHENTKTTLEKAQIKLGETKTLFEKEKTPKKKLVKISQSIQKLDTDNNSVLKLVQGALEMQKTALANLDGFIAKFRNVWKDTVK